MVEYVLVAGILCLLFYLGVGMRGNSFSHSSSITDGIITPRREDLCPKDGADSSLNADKVMDIIRMNGYTPELNGTWVVFEANEQHYAVDTLRLPMMSLLLHFYIDKIEWDTALVREAAHLVSDEVFIGKVLLTGNDDGICFQVGAFENDDKHLLECLAMYIGIIDEMRSKFTQVYNNLNSRQSDNAGTLPINS